MREELAFEYLSRVKKQVSKPSPKLMSSETPTESPEVSAENTMSPEIPDVEEKVKSSDNPVEGREAGSDKEECLEPMSKRQRKKLLKQKQWEEQKDLRRYGFLGSCVVFSANNKDLSAELHRGCFSKSRQLNEFFSVPGLKQ